MKKFYALVGVSCLGLLAGCGGDSQGSEHTVDTGIAEDKALSDVTETEARQACERTRDAMRDIVDRDMLIAQVCTMFVVGPATSEASCNDLRDQCVQEASESEDAAELGEVDFECDGDTSEFEGCDVTVGTLEKCLNDSLGAVDAMLHRYSCRDAANLTDDDVEQLGGFELETPASCQTLEDRCDGAGVLTDQVSM